MQETLELHDEQLHPYSCYCRLCEAELAAAARNGTKMLPVWAWKAAAPEHYAHCLALRNQLELAQ